MGRLDDGTKRLHNESSPETERQDAQTRQVSDQRRVNYQGGRTEHAPQRHCHWARAPLRCPCKESLRRYLCLPCGPCSRTCECDEGSTRYMNMLALQKSNVSSIRPDAPPFAHVFMYNGAESSMRQCARPRCRCRCQCPYYTKQSCRSSVQSP
ncbi:hypothetical protein LY78DRAFT_129996 [Colletotrichum sublineola]|nr:hypothetical protein LY78DRAFT_129996 [Colletotrichum sublineola]